MKKQIGNGSLVLPMARGRFYRVYGGPYKQRPETINGHPSAGVKMAVEIKLPASVDLPVHDFQVPDKSLLDTALLDTVKLIATGVPVYVGCMGGIGRTGLMLAILVKAFSVTDPIKYVRANYIPHAVETEQQKQFVNSYVVPKEVADLVLWLKIKSFFRWNRALTAGE